MGNFKARPNHTMLKEMGAGYGSLFKFKCNETGYVELSETVTFSRNTCP